MTSRKICYSPLSLKNNTAIIYDAIWRAERQIVCLDKSLLCIRLIWPDDIQIFIRHLICEKTKGRWRPLINKRTAGPFAFLGGRRLVIYKIKSIRDLSRGIINGTGCATWEHKGSLARTRDGVLSKDCDGRADCVVLLLFSSRGWLKDSGGHFNQRGQQCPQSARSLFYLPTIWPHCGPAFKGGGRHGNTC